MREYITKEEALMALTGQFELGITMQKYSASCQKHIEAIQPKTEQEIVNPYLDKIKAEIAEYGSIWVEYKITGRRDKDIEQLVSDVLSQAKKQVLEVIDKYKAESEEAADGTGNS